jgi:hypothetical protein
MQMLIVRLEVERLLTAKVAGQSPQCDTITYPAALDLPQSLHHPETMPRTLSVPLDFRCPLGSGVMTTPVVTPSGLTYERCDFQNPLVLPAAIPSPALFLNSFCVLTHLGSFHVSRDLLFSPLLFFGLHDRNVDV